MSTLIFSCALSALGSQAAFCLPQPLGPTLEGEPQSYFGFDTIGYLYPAEANRDSVLPAIQGRWEGKTEGPVFEAVARPEVMFALPPASDYYIDSPELYVGTSGRLAPVQLDLGRKLVHWNHLDEYWQLGIWQPRFRWDYLHPEAVGLAGAFLTVSQPKFQLVAWGSPFFVPERGVQIDASGGELTSRSRWFISPPSMLSIFDNDTPIHYHLDIPDTSSIVNNSGVSVMARVGGERGFWGSAGYAYKPINQLLLADDGYLRLSASNPVYADVTIYPRVAYHQLASLEGGYATDRVSAWISMLDERPIRDQTPSNWTTQEIQPSFAISSSVDWNVGGEPANPTQLGLSYLRQWGGNAPDQGPLPSSSGSMFEPRYPFQNAVSLDFQSPLTLLGGAARRLTAFSRLLYDVSHDGTIWSTELHYRTRTAWTFAFGADLLNSYPSPVGDDFITRFRGNDRVHAGVSYVF